MTHRKGHPIRNAIVGAVALGLVAFGGASKAHGQDRPDLAKGKDKPAAVDTRPVDTGKRVVQGEKGGLPPLMIAQAPLARAVADLAVAGPDPRLDSIDVQISGKDAREMASFARSKVTFEGNDRRSSAFTLNFNFTDDQGLVHPVQVIVSVCREAECNEKLGPGVPDKVMAVWIDNMLVRTLDLGRLEQKYDVTIDRAIPLLGIGKDDAGRYFSITAAPATLDTGSLRYEMPALGLTFQGGVLKVGVSAIRR